MSTMSNENEQLYMPRDTKGRIVTIVVLVLVLVTIWFMLTLTIETFVLTFVFYHLLKYAQFGLSKTPLPKLPDALVQILIYAGVIALLVWFITYNAQVLIQQISGIADTISRFNIADFLKNLDPNLQTLINGADINSYIDKIGALLLSGLTSAGTAVLSLLLAFLLSFLLVLEKEKIRRIGKAIEGSRVAFIYRYFVLFGGSFCYTFGKVMKVQVLIAAINCGISMIYLTITGFPSIFALGLMIFILGLIPVAGVFISLIPLTIIAFNIGGPWKIVEVLIMIAIIHCLEAYFLNPKLMSRKTELPVSIVFIVLIVAQQYLGMWGLLIGVPVFIYLLAVLDVRYRLDKNAPSDTETGRNSDSLVYNLRHLFKRRKKEE